MTESLLVTKSYIPPLRSSIVARPHLIQKLQEGYRRGRPLTLVCAPAGFGKSTLVVAWLAEISQPQQGADSQTPRSAWLSLDAADNDPVRFWLYVITALRTIDDKIGLTSQAMLQSPHPPPLEAMVTALVNELATLRRPLIMVLDDYHAIRSAAIHESVSFLLDHLPPSVHWVICTREDPPLALSRRRARQQMTEIRASDLRFTLDEARTLFNESLGADLSDADVTSLTTRTEGWIVGLQMAGLSLNTQVDKQHFIQSFAGDDRYIADYLVEEVLQSQPQDIQSFLLQTAILERLSGPLCDAVLAQTPPATEAGSDTVPAQKMLEQLDHANLFIVPLDNRREWYRYHHLFADLLCQHLLQTAETQQVTQLHRRAALWFEQHAQVFEAFEHAFATGDMAFAAETLARRAYIYFQRHELSTFCSNANRLPWQVVSRLPMLCIAYGWAALAIGRPQDCERSIVAVEQATHTLHAQALEQLQAAQTDALLRMAMLESWVMKAQIAITRRDFVSGRNLSEEVLPYLVDTNKPGAFNSLNDLRPVAYYNLGLSCEGLGNVGQATAAFEQAAEISGQLPNLYLYPLAVTHLAHTRMMLGQLHEAAAIYADMLHSDIAAQLNSPLFGATDVGLGDLSYEWNDLAAAERYYEAGIKRTQDWQSWETLLPAYSGLAKIQRARGDIPAALGLLDELCEACRNNAALVQPSVEALRANLWVTQGDLALATQWAAGSGLDAHQAIPPHREAEALALARVYAAQQHTAEALLIVERLIAQAGDLQHWKLVIEALILQALLLALSQPNDALQALSRAVQLGLPGGFIRSFVDAGDPLRELLRHLQPRDVLTQGYLQRLLGHFSTEAGITSPEARPATQAGLAEPLTEREQDVLRLIAEGFSNQQIAERLIISTATVKTHVTNINGKLGAASRTQAVAIARSLGILRAS